MSSRASLGRGGSKSRRVSTNRGFINAVRSPATTPQGRKRIHSYPLHITVAGLCDLVVQSLHSNIRLPYPQPTDDPEYQGRGQNEQIRHRNQQHQRYRHAKSYTGLYDEKVEQRLVRRRIRELAAGTE